MSCNETSHRLQTFPLQLLNRAILYWAKVVHKFFFIYLKHKFLKAKRFNNKKLHWIFYDLLKYFDLLSNNQIRDYFNSIISHDFFFIYSQVQIPRFHYRKSTTLEPSTRNSDIELAVQFETAIELQKLVTILIIETLLPIKLSVIIWKAALYWDSHKCTQ